ncbi:MAG: CheR family methyltransferase [Candidatus Solibacter sp.]
MLAASRRQHPILITGTDLNPEALEMAAKGVYRLTAFKEMDAEIRGQYFSEAGQHLSVKADLKACVTFERRDVLTGAPSNDLDLISCRSRAAASFVVDSILRVWSESLTLFMNSAPRDPGTKLSDQAAAGLDPAAVIETVRRTIRAAS